MFVFKTVSVQFAFMVFHIMNVKRLSSTNTKRFGLHTNEKKLNNFYTP